MKALMGSIFLLSLAAMFVVYPMYFFMLNEFKKKLAEQHPQLWDSLRRAKAYSELQCAYAALGKIKEGEFEGVAISASVMKLRNSAVMLLYSGMVLFMVVLGIGLVDSVLQGKNH